MLNQFAVEGLTEALVLELKPFGIRATVIEPGSFRADFLLARSRTAILDYAEAGRRSDARGAHGGSCPPRLTTIRIAVEAIKYRPG